MGLSYFWTNARNGISVWTDTCFTRIPESQITKCTCALYSITVLDTSKWAIKTWWTQGSGQNVRAFARRARSYRRAYEEVRRNPLSDNVVSKRLIEKLVKVHKCHRSTADQACAYIKSVLRRGTSEPNPSALHDEGVRLSDALSGVFWARHRPSQSICDTVTNCYYYQFWSKIFYIQKSE